MRLARVIQRGHEERDGWRWLSAPVLWCAGVVFLVAPGPLIMFYTHDARVLAVGPSLFWIAAAFQIFDGIQTVSTGALRGLGETRVPMIANSSATGRWDFLSVSSSVSC